MNDTSLFLVYDGAIIGNSDFRISPHNRAFEYGDSLFETIIAYKGEPLNWRLHWERLNRGLDALGYQTPPQGIEWKAQQLFIEIGELLVENRLSKDYARLKIKVWREEGGKYSPSNSGFHYLISSASFSPTSPRQLQAGISETVQLHPSPWSSCKTGSALPYVQAGRERMAKGWDEIILLSSDGSIAEAGASNLFWQKDGKWHTPALSTACLGGVMRQRAIGFFENKMGLLSTGHYTVEDFLAATHIFTTNVAGMNHICTIGAHTYLPWEGLASLWKECLQG